MSAQTQAFIDSFYLSNNKRPCCAGCDWWRFYNSTVGECTKSPPVSASERWAILGIEAVTVQLPAGHIMTKRDHSCGGFVDTYDWE